MATPSAAAQDPASTPSTSTSAPTPKRDPRPANRSATKAQRPIPGSKPGTGPVSASTLPPLKILCLHGYTQSGPQFASKTGALRKTLSTAFAPRAVELIYPTGPLRLRARDIPGYESDSANHDPGSGIGDEDADGDGDEGVEAFGWWRRKDYQHTQAPNGSAGTGHAATESRIVYTGLDEGLATIAATIRDSGPFDGVLGFSQGACAAGMVAALLDGGSAERRAALEASAGIDGSTNSISDVGDGSEAFAYPASFLTAEGEPIQAPLKFAIMYSGFRAPGALYEPFWKPSIGVRSLHVIGSLDTVVSEQRSLSLLEAFDEESRTLVRHPGAHFVPSAKNWGMVVVGFVRDALKSAEAVAEE